MLRIEATATDSDGNPLEGVELWVMHRLQPAPPVARASRYGITDARGQLSALDCYMSRNTFMFWSPEKEPLRLELLALKTGFGVERVSVSPPLDDVLAAGSLVTTKPGEWAHGDNSISEWRGRAYPVKVSVVLHGTVAR